MAPLLIRLTVVAKRDISKIADFSLCDTEAFLPTNHWPIVYLQNLSSCWGPLSSNCSLQLDCAIFIWDGSSRYSIKLTGGITYRPKHRSMNYRHRYSSKDWTLKTVHNDQDTNNHRMNLQCYSAEFDLYQP